MLERTPKILQLRQEQPQVRPLGLPKKRTSHRPTTQGCVLGEERKGAPGWGDRLGSRN